MAAEPAAPAPPPDPPKSWVDKVGAALPIALTAIATAFAGMSSSEMSQAMYWRSAAAQDQAKANDQWTFAGFKRDRSLIVETAAAALKAAAGYRAPSAGADAATTAVPGIVEQVGRWMGSDKSAKEPPAPPTDDPVVREVLNAIHYRDRDEEQVVRLSGKIDPRKLAAAIETAAVQSAEVEKAWDGERDRVRKAAREAAAAAGKASGPGDARVAEASTAQAAQFEVDTRRYRAESTMNFWVGYLYEVRVKTSTAESDRHRERSKNFFYAMLAGQVGATLASLGLARRQRSALWAVAGTAGIVAVGFGAYVYLGM